MCSAGWGPRDAVGANDVDGGANVTAFGCCGSAVWRNDCAAKPLAPAAAALTFGPNASGDGTGADVLQLNVSVSNSTSI